MFWSDIPACCILNILVRAGLQKPHWPDDIMQLASSEQLLHWQEMWRATRRTSSLVICDSVCAKQSAVAVNSRKLFFHRRMLPRDADHLRARILALHLARHQGHQCPEYQRERPDPDPIDQGKYIGLKHDAVAVYTREVQVQVFVQPLAQRHLVRGLAARLVDAL